MTAAGAPITASPVVGIRPLLWWRELGVVVLVSAAVGLTPGSPAAEQVGTWLAWPVAAAVLRELRGDGSAAARTVALWLGFAGLSGLAWAHALSAGAAGVGDLASRSAPAAAALCVGLPLAVSGASRTWPGRATGAAAASGALVAIVGAGPVQATGWAVVAGAGMVAVTSLLLHRRGLAGQALLRSSWLLVLLSVLIGGGVLSWAWPEVSGGPPPPVGVSTGIAAALTLALPAVVVWLIAAERFRPLVGLAAAAGLVLVGALLVAMTYLLGRALLPAGATNRVGSDATRVAVTVLVAAALVPAGRAVYLTVLERAYGPVSRPRSAQALVARLAQQGLAPGASADLVLDELAATVATALRLPGARILTTEPTVASVGTTVLALDTPSDSPAWLVLEHRRGREPLSPADDDALHRLLPSVALVVHATRLAAHVERSRAAEAASREAERDRLRRDLHDGLGPLLSGLAMHARALARHAPDDLVEEVQTLAAGLADARTDLRRVVDGLGPVAVADRPAGESFEVLLEQWRRAAGSVGLRLEAQVDLLPAVVPGEVVAAAHLVIGEAVANAVRHAGARLVEVGVCAEDDDLVLEVRDDGAGLPVSPRPGIGLASMAERARTLGGSLEVLPAPGGGTVLTARLPLREGGR